MPTIELTDTGEVKVDTGIHKVCRPNNRTRKKHVKLSQTISEKDYGCERGNTSVTQVKQLNYVFINI